MPIYEYICMECNNIFSLLQKTGSSEKDTVCSQCGSGSVKKKFSAFSSSSAGGGFSATSPFSGFGGGG